MLATNTIRPATTPELLGCQVPPFCLRLHGGPLDGQEIRLTSAKVSVGGARGCTLRLRSPGSLPLYVWVLRGPEGCVVRRFAPHVLLNGGAFDEAALYDGDRLRIGGIELEIVSGACSKFVELNEETDAGASGDVAEAAILRADASGAGKDESPEAAPADPWMRPYKRAFASRSNQTSQQRRALRQHLARRTRKLLETLRQQDRELESLQNALQQKSADAVRLTSAQQAAADHERIQLEEEARELAELVQQMSHELREASAQRARTSAELEQQNKLRTQIEQRELELRRARDEADEVRRSTAAQIEQLTHAFELVRQERDELAKRQEREGAQDRSAQATIESLQADLTEMSARRGALQARLEQVTKQLAAAEESRSAEQPQLEQQLKFLNVELERRDRELADARTASSSQSQQLLTSLDQLRQELAELQSVRERERQQASTEAARLADELTTLKAQLAQRESDLRTARSGGEAEVTSLRAELERAQADAAHVRQQMTRERSEGSATRTQLEAELKSLTQQLERRTADWQAAQQTSAAETAHFNKTIEQLRSELQSERSLRERDGEARLVERRRGEAELATARQQSQAQAAQIDELQRRLASEANRLTLQLDQARREAEEVQERFEAEQTRWEQQREELLQNVDSLATTNRQQVEELAQAHQGAAGTEQQLHSELISAAEQLRELNKQNHELREQTTELQLALDDTQARLASLESGSVVAGEGIAESFEGSAASEQVLAEAHEQIAAAQQELQAEKAQWQQQRETWEVSLRQREEDLAVQIAELERQVGEWHERQSQQRPIGHDLHEGMNGLQAEVTPDAVYGSYTPARNELPPDVTMPLPQQLDAEEIESYSQPESRYGETAPFPARADWDRADEEPTHEETLNNQADVAEQSASDSQSEAPRDSDSVTAVLSRLMQAGLWHADADEQPAGVDRTLAIGQPSERSLLNELSPDPVFDPPTAEDVSEQIEGADGEADFSHTMDISSLMGNRGETPRSWRAELLGEEQPSHDEPVAEEPAAAAEQDPLAALRALRAEVNEERHDDSPNHEPEPETELDEKLPEQAVGHGSWRAQLLGGDAAAEPATPAIGLSATDDSSSHFEEPAEQAPPTFTPVAAPESASAGGEDEDSIEAYMSKLLKRVRGDAPQAAWSPSAATPAPAVEAKPVKAAPTAPQQPMNPVDASEFVPQRQAPEASLSLAAMREIANAASRVAIDTHAKRRHTERFAQRMIKTAVALITTVGFAVWGLYSGGSGPWFGVAVGLLLMAYWSAQSVWHIVRALRLKPMQATAGGLEETTEFVKPNEPVDAAAQ